MSKKGYVRVVRRGSGEALVEAARWCGSRWCRLVGLQFRRRLRPGEAIILAKEKDSVAASSIHMFFVFFPIAAVWINSQGRVTSAQLAKPWRPYYASPEPACYVLEAEPEALERFCVGDEVEFVEGALAR
jgi:uncharacterized membrane protein (UPF0127 family)